MEQQKFKDEIRDILNIQKRNIIIVGETGTGKNKLMDSLMDICSNNTEKIDGTALGNIQNTLHLSELRATILKIGGINTTLIIDEIVRLKEELESITDSIGESYENYVITIHGKDGDISVLESIVGKEFIENTKPIIVKTDRKMFVQRRNTGHFSVEIVDKYS